jgi:hypothetical protein
MGLTLPVATLIAGLAGTGANAVSNISTNRAQRRWNEAMYNRQREDALADWARTNEYNSPLAQMQRFKEAGLNPNLIYGQTNTAAPVRSTESKSWSPQAPAFNFGQIVDQYLQSKQAGASIDLVNTQIENVKAATEGKLIENLKNSKGLPFIEPMAQAKLEGVLQDNKYKGALTTLTLDRNEREQIRLTNDISKTSQDILESKQRIAKSQQEVDNLKVAKKILEETAVLKKLQAAQRAMGLDDDYTQAEWFLAQAAYDPKNAVEVLNKYIEAIGWMAEKGVKQTGEALANTLKSVWEALKSKFSPF